MSLRTPRPALKGQTRIEVSATSDEWQILVRLLGAIERDAFQSRTCPIRWPHEPSRSLAVNTSKLAARSGYRGLACKARGQLGSPLKAMTTHPRFGTDPSFSAVIHMLKTNEDSLLRRSPSVSLALHFRFIDRGDYLNSQLIGTRLLARALWAVKPYLAETGPLIVRGEKLFYTQDLEPHVLAAWQEEVLSCNRWPLIDAATLGDLDRIFVVVLTGRLLGIARELCGRLCRAGRHPLLLGLVVTPDATQLQSIYLSRRCTPIGMLHSGDRIELAFDAIEYSPYLERMLDLMKIDATVSRAALDKTLELMRPRRVRRQG